MKTPETEAKALILTEIKTIDGVEIQAETPTHIKIDRGTHSYQIRYDEPPKDWNNVISKKESDPQLTGWVIIPRDHTFRVRIPVLIY